jgi:hypothetical protein
MLDNAELLSMNLERLKLIDLSIRENIKQTLIDMYLAGHRPLIHQDVYRTPAEQLDKFNRGVSTLKWGFHCATNPDGTPGSLAADIVDANHGWFAEKEYYLSNIDEKFWVCLGRCALKNNLGWGGFFGISDETKIRQELSENTAYNGQQFGWDVAHVQTNNVSVIEAMNGKR